MIFFYFIEKNNFWNKIRMACSCSRLLWLQIACIMNERINLAGSIRNVYHRLLPQFTAVKITGCYKVAGFLKSVLTFHFASIHFFLVSVSYPFCCFLLSPGQILLAEISNICRFITLRFIWNLSLPQPAYFFVANFRNAPVLPLARRPDWVLMKPE
ncbi:MAG: hypothetical protein JWQ40_5108 [Segetibacter sp.]|nr:hypothetical protein [Segetibacter sp.]